MYADGYKYWLAYKTNTTSYYRCCRYLSSKCPGRYIVEEGNQRNTTAHTHAAEPDRALVDQFRKILTHRAATENTELYAIYCDEATSRHSDAAMLYPFASAESAMRKARRKQLPQTPNTVSDIIGVLDKSDLFRVNSGSDKDSIYQKTITLEDSSCMIFLHRKTIELFGRIDEIHLDGTFDFVSEPQASYHLITIHAVQGYVTAPIVYAVLTAKTQSAYASLFAYIREELGIMPNMIMSDFDQTMQTSLAYTFPEAILKGCWFHYTDAVLTHMKNLRLQRETSKGVGASALRMLLVLPLLPAEYMSPGLESLKKWMKEKNIYSSALENLCNYVEQGWLRAVGAEKMSIFGTPRSISNHVKNFNKDLAAVIGAQNPVIWVILESITQIATKTFVKINKQMKAAKSDSATKSSSKKPGRSQRKSEVVTDTIISSATQLWIKTPVHLRNPLQFLQLSSHCINDTIYLANLTDTRHTLRLSSSTAVRHQSWLPEPPQAQQQSLTYNLQKQPQQLQSSTTYGCLTSNQSYMTTSQAQCTDSTQHTFSNFYTTVQSSLTSCDQQQPIQTAIVQIRSPISSDPPPLAFFPTVKRLATKRRLPVLSEPPPLVPISSNRIRKI